MYIKNKIFTTLLILIAFTGQTVLACACEIETSAMESHGHHDIDHDMDHDCDSACHLSAMETDGQEFVPHLDGKYKTDKNIKTISLSIAGEEVFGFFDARKTAISRFTIPYLSRENSLFVQKTLLRI